jgi:hypothetical protein
VSQLVDGQDASNKKNMNPNEIDDWLHRNDSLHANNIDDILISNRLSCKIVVNMESTPTFLCVVNLSVFLYTIERIIDGYLVCIVCIATILTKTQLCR